MTEDDTSDREPKKDASEIATPAPQDTGSEGTQGTAPAASTGGIVQVVRPLEFDQGHLGAVLGEHIDTRSPAAIAFAVAAYRDGEAYRAAVMRKWDESEREKAEYRERWHEAATRNAVLEERQKEGGRRTLVMLVGGLVAGAGLSVAAAERTAFNVGGLLLLLGLVLIAIASPLRRSGD
jgi:hypothetical protein